MTAPSADIDVRPPLLYTLRALLMIVSASRSVREVRAVLLRTSRLPTVVRDSRFTREDRELVLAIIRPPPTVFKSAA